MSHQQASRKQPAEPEIIPPSARVPLRDRDAMWTLVNERGTHRIYIARLGPLALSCWYSASASSRLSFLFS